MFHFRGIDKKIKNVHERAVRIVYSHYKSTFQEPLGIDPSFSVHHKNIQTLATEIYKHIHGLSPAIIGRVFKINRTLPCNFRTHNEISVKQ